MRRSPKRWAETSWQPIRRPSVQIPSGSVHFSGLNVLRSCHWKLSALRTRVSGSARYQWNIAGDCGSSKIGRRSSSAYSGRSASVSGRRVRSPARRTRPNGGCRVASVGGVGGAVIG